MDGSVPGAVEDAELVLEVALAEEAAAREVVSLGERSGALYFSHYATLANCF